MSLWNLWRRFWGVINRLYVPLTLTNYHNLRYDVENNSVQEVENDTDLLSKIQKLQHENDELHHENVELQHENVELQHENVELQRENVELKDLLSKIREEKDAVIKKLEGKVRNLEDLLRKADSPTSQGKQYGRMLRSDYDKIQSKFMVLLDNIKEPNALCQTLFANGVFDDNDKEVVQKCLREETTRNATDKLLSILMNCGENAYHRFLKCLKQTGYDQVINRLEQTEEPNNQNPEEIRTLEVERDTPAQILATKQKDDIDSKLQQLTDEKSSILTELSELKFKMAAIETERQDEDADMMKEIKECHSREKHLLTNQQRISKEIKKLEEEVHDLKEGDRLLTMESNIENLLYLFNEHHEITKVHSIDVTIPEIRDNRPNLSDDIDISVDGSRNNTLSSEITKIQDQDVTVRVEQECRQQTDTDDKYEHLVIDEENKGMTIPDDKTTDNNTMDVESICRTCLRGTLDDVKNLILHNKDFNIRDVVGRTPLFDCVWSRNQPVEKVKLLVSTGARLDVKDEGGRSLLHWACWYSTIECIRYLLEQGLDKDGRDYINRTPLFDCVWSQTVESDHLPVEKMKLLVSTGAMVDVKDEYGCSLLDYACYYSRECETYLRELGLDK